MIIRFFPFRPNHADALAAFIAGQPGTTSLDYITDNLDNLELCYAAEPNTSPAIAALITLESPKNTPINTVHIYLNLRQKRNAAELFEAMIRHYRATQPAFDKIIISNASHELHVMSWLKRNITGKLYVIPASAWVNGKPSDYMEYHVKIRQDPILKNRGDNGKKEDPETAQSPESDETPVHHNRLWLRHVQQWAVQFFKRH